MLISLKFSLLEERSQCHGGGREEAPLRCRALGARHNISMFCYRSSHRNTASLTGMNTLLGVELLYISCKFNLESNVVTR